MKATLPSQPAKIKASIRSNSSEHDNESRGDSLSRPRESSSPALGDRHQRPTNGRTIPQRARRTLRASAPPSTRPLLDEIERQELTEFLIAILKALMSQRVSENTDSKEGQVDR